MPLLCRRKLSFREREIWIFLIKLSNYFILSEWRERFLSLLCFILLPATAEFSSRHLIRLVVRQFLIVIYINDRILWCFIYFNFTHVGIFYFLPQYFPYCRLVACCCRRAFSLSLPFAVFFPASQKCLLRNIFPLFSLRSPPRHIHSCTAHTHTPLSHSEWESINISFFMRVTLFLLVLYSLLPPLYSSYFLNFWKIGHYYEAWAYVWRSLIV